MTLRNFFIFLTLVVLGITGYFLFWKSGEKPGEERACTLEAQICPDGSAVGRIPPSCEFAPCPSMEEKKQKESASYKDMIRVEMPLPESTVSSPLTIRGEARGGWYFEASFPVVLTDWDGRIIAEGVAMAQGDWMTNEYVPFTAELSFTADTRVSNRGALILQKSNPSGLPQNADAFEYTIFFVQSSK